MKLGQSLALPAATFAWLHRSTGDPAPQSPVRTLVVPHGVVAVKRTSPIPVRKKTPWRRDPDGTGATRAGGREWFSDGLFVESKQANLPAACGTSALFHAACAIVIALLLLARTGPAPLVRVAVSLRMPSMDFLLPAAAPPPAAGHAIAAPAAAPPKVAPVEAAVQTQPDAPEAIAAPADRPPEVEAPGDAPGGAVDGVPGGIADGAGNGASWMAGHGLAPGAVAPPAPDAGPFRIVAGIERPRKIKDVKPIYPAGALAQESRGAVILDITVGTDGRVHDARVLQSIPALDQAALDAVRQWEFVPGRRNGEAVAVIVTAVVSFAIL